MRSDEALMEATRDGELEAFEQLVERHRDTAVAVAYRVVGQEADAEELAQEAFLKIFEAANRYEATASFTTYLYRVVTNLCYDRLEKNQPHSMEPSRGMNHRGGEDDPEETLLRREENQAIQSALQSLPTRQRIAITLQQFEDLSYAEIAEAMDVTEKAVERLIARARDQLHEVLVDQDALDVPRS
jgi:RNA polymerase sigma-70 factor (ECF subfamily)